MKSKKTAVGLPWMILEVEWLLLVILKTVPVDYIKIDGSFVQDLINDPLSRAVVDSIHRIARVMQITTIAEHAEDQETLEALQSIGIDYVQGYIISRPEKLC